MNMNNTVSSSTDNVELKLRSILKRIFNDGYDLAHGVDILADKISGSVPKPEQAQCKAPSADCLIGLVTDIEVELSNVLYRIRESLARAHSGVGVFSREPESCDLARQVDPFASLAAPPVDYGIKSQLGRPSKY